MAYIELLKQDALEDFRHMQLMYAAKALKDPPKIPEILK